MLCCSNFIHDEIDTSHRRYCCHSKKNNTFNNDTFVSLRFMILSQWMADWFYGFDAFIHLQDIQSTFANITMNTCHFWINRQHINCARITLSPSSACFGDDAMNTKNMKDTKNDFTYAQKCFQKYMAIIIRNTGYNAINISLQ